MANRTFYQKKNGSIEPFWSSIFEAGMEPFLVLNRTISSKSVWLKQYHMALETAWVQSTGNA